MRGTVFQYHSIGLKTPSVLTVAQIDTNLLDQTEKLRSLNFSLCFPHSLPPFQPSALFFFGADKRVSQMVGQIK